MVVAHLLRQLEGAEIVQVEVDLTELNFLIHGFPHANLLDIVLLIRRVEHLWYVVWILLLGDTSIDSNVRVRGAIDDEGELQLMILGDVGLYRVLVHRHLKVEVLELTVFLLFRSWCVLLASLIQ